jgi:HK97 family phage major capsid protein
MDAYLRSLTDRIGQAWQAQKDLLDSTLEEGRSLTSEEREQVERMDSDLDTLIEERKRYSERADVLEKVNAFRDETAPHVEAAREQRRDPTDRELLMQLYNGEIRSFESKESPEFRALQSEGGSAVPTTFADMVSVYARTLNPVLGVARVLNTPTGGPLVIPRVTADAAGGGTVTAENAGITLADSTISQVTLNAYGYKSIQVVSAQLWRDNVIDLERILAETGGRQIGLEVGADMTIGSGSDEPNGFVTAGSAGHTATGTASGESHDAFFSPADLVDLYMSVVVPWRVNGTWMVSNSALGRVRKFRDANGMFMYDPGLQVGQAPSLLGRPIYENPAMAAAASAATSAVAFGDFSQYVVRQLPLRVDVSQEYAWSSDGIGIRIIWEGDGDLMHATAIRKLKCADA